MIITRTIKLILFCTLLSVANPQVQQTDLKSAHRQLNTDVYDEFNWFFDGVNYTDIKPEIAKHTSCDGEFIRCITFRDEDYEVCVYNKDSYRYTWFQGYCEMDFHNCLVYKWWGLPRFGRHYVDPKYRYVGDWPCSTRYSWWENPLSRGMTSWPPYST